jgi:hypothetical protein
VEPRTRLLVPRSATGTGFSVALSKDGTTVLVGGPFVSAVYVFHVSSRGAWKSTAKPVAKLTDSLHPADLGSALALSADGTTALVGETSLGADVFHVATAASWRSSSTPAATLVTDPVGAQEFGLDIAVALSADGTTALIGAVRDGNFVGGGYIFRATAPDAWVSSATPDAVLTEGGVGQSADYFGFAVALSPGGKTALVGAPFAGFGGPAGAAYFFQVPSPRDWAYYEYPVAVVQRGVDQSGGAGDILGVSVALSAEGTALVAQPPYYGRRPGHAEILQIAGSNGSWASGKLSSARLTDAAGPPGNRFGSVVGLSSDGTTALVSSKRATFIFTRRGSRTAKFCYVPYLYSAALPAAKRAIEAARCSLGTVTRVSALHVRRGHVVSVTPKPGERLPDGGAVDLTVSDSRR